MSAIPFRMVCSILQEYPELADLEGFNDKPIFLDATGSVVVKTDDYRKRVLYYAAVMSLRPTETMSIAEFLTDSHTARNIQHCLESALPREFWKNRVICTDFSMAIIKAIAFMKGYESVVHFQNENSLKSSEIRICRAHMMKILMNLATKHFSKFWSFLKNLKF